MTVGPVSASCSAATSGRERPSGPASTPRAYSLGTPSAAELVGAVEGAFVGLLPAAGDPRLRQLERDLHVDDVDAVADGSESLPQLDGLLGRGEHGIDHDVQPVPHRFVADADRELGGLLVHEGGQLEREEPLPRRLGGANLGRHDRAVVAAVLDRLSVTPPQSPYADAAYASICASSSSWTSGGAQDPSTELRASCTSSSRVKPARDASAR
jgi:hypothetical protein